MDRGSAMFKCLHSSFQGVLQIVDKYGSELSIVNVSTAFVYLAKIIAPGHHSQLLLERKEFALLIRMMGAFVSST